MEILVVIIFAMALWIGSLYEKRHRLQNLLSDQTEMYTVLYKAAVMTSDANLLVDYMAYYNELLPHNSNNVIIKSLYLQYGLEPEGYDSIDSHLRYILKEQAKQDYLVLHASTPRHERLLKELV